MRPFVLAVLVLVPLAGAHHGDPLAVYLEASGHFRAGLVAVGVGDPGDDVPVPLPAEAGPVNLAAATFTAHVCHSVLQVDLDFRPTNASASAPGLFVAVPFEFQVELVDPATDEKVPDAVMRYTSPGTRSFALGRAYSGILLRADLYMLRGAEADWDLRLRGMPDPFLPCDAPPIVNEVEANPAGVDAGNEWVELYNPNLVPVDVSGWTLQATHGVPSSLTLPEGTVLAAEGRLVVEFTSGQALDNVDEVIELEDAHGVLQDWTPALADEANDDRTHQRAFDGPWAGWVFAAGTRDAANTG